MEMAGGYGVRAVQRSFAVLRVLSEASGPRSLPSIASEAGLTVTTTFRLLRTLMAEGVVQAHEEGYMLGLRVLELAEALSRQLDIVRVARPFLLRLQAELDETCGLGARSGDSWVTVAHVESTQPVRRVMRVGERQALAATATGRVFLAHDSDADVSAYVSRTDPEVYREAVGGPEQLWASIHDIRERGYAWVVNARNTGGWGIRHPVYRHNGEIAAVLSIACPRDRFADEFRDRCREAGRRIAQEMSTSLGYTGGYPRVLSGVSGGDAARPSSVGALAGQASRSPTSWEE
ncbi:MAG: IclR family transcriptional regulator [Chloroflexota bacterium]